MHTRYLSLAAGLFAGALLTTSAFAQGSSPAAKPIPAVSEPMGDAETMAKMMALAQPGESHRLLAQLVGDWDYKVRFSMAPGDALAEAGNGTAVRTAIMGGRYFIMNISGKVLMPGADGKVAESDFKGMSLEGYDNVKQKFVSTWIDSMGTSMTMSEGSYDPASKSFNYPLEMEVLPGVKTKARQVLQIVDADHLRLDWYETQGGKEAKTMEIDYARKK